MMLQQCEVWHVLAQRKPADGVAYTTQFVTSQVAGFKM